MSDAKEAVAKAAVFFESQKTYNCNQEFDQRKNTKNELVFQEQTCLRRETYRIQ